MAKIKLRIQGTSYLYGVKTFSDMLMGLRSVKQLKYLTASLILLFSIIGCSDVPYTGPILAVDDVNRYSDSTGEDTVCLQDGFDTVCLRIVQEIGESSGRNIAPIIHVHPASIAYVFRFEGQPILLAEKAMDTSDIVQGLIDSERVQLPPNSITPNTVNTGGWTIQVYYPESFPEANRGRTPETSGLNIRVVEGMKLSISAQEALEMQNFKQVNGTNGSRGVQFSIETKNVEITIHVNGLVSDHTAKFYINADDVASGDDNSTFELEPIR